MASFTKDNGLDFQAVDDAEKSRLAESLQLCSVGQPGAVGVLGFGELTFYKIPFTQVSPPPPARTPPALY